MAIKLSNFEPFILLFRLSGPSSEDEGFSWQLNLGGYSQPTHKTPQYPASDLPDYSEVVQVTAEEKELEELEEPPPKFSEIQNQNPTLKDSNNNNSNNALHM